MCLVGAGVFRADPAAGFPVNTSAPAPAPVTWHGVLHLAVGGVGSVCLLAASLVLARRFAGAGRGGWAAVSRVTGALLVLALVGVAASGGASAANLAFTAAVMLSWGWLSAVSMIHYRATTRTEA